MNKYLLTTIVLVLFLVLAVAGCGGQEPQPAPTPTPQPEALTQSAEEIVREMVALMNAGEVEKSLEFFAEDAAVYIVGLPPTGMEVYIGKDQIRTLWQDSVDNHFQWEIEIESVMDNRVLVLAKTWHDFTRQLGVAPLEYHDVYGIQDGKITTYGTTITEDALAKFKPAFNEAVPPEEPAPSTEQPVSEMTVTIAGGTCRMDQTAPLQAGEITLNWIIEDQNKELYALTIFTLDEGKDFLDLMASTAGSPPTWGDLLFYEEMGPGKSRTWTFAVETGPIYVICWSKPPDLPIGNIGPIEVKE